MSIAGEYTVGWICALQEEFDTACQMLDEEFEGMDTTEVNDNNTYVFGTIHGHNVVIACLPGGQYGTSPAASTFKDMVRSFPKLRFGLMVGIGGGAPTRDREVRLGDVVVSEPRNELGGVVQFDLGKRLPDGSFKRKGQLNAPPQVLLGALPTMRRLNNDPKKPDLIAENIKRMDDWLDYQRPTTDNLYRTDFEHRGGKTCENCGVVGLVVESERTPRPHPQGRAVAVHYGTIASSNSVLKDARQRDEFANDPSLEVLCFEMEAAGLMNNFPCLVIRGICDYCDSHKNDEWHNYAALAAAAYTRELLRVAKPQRVASEPPWTARLEASMSSLQRGIDDVLQYQSSQEDSQILNWLSPIDQSRRQADMARGRIKAGQSFLQSPTFHSWLNSSQETLFCPGMPGAGKSVLASMIIDELRSRRVACNPRNRIGVAFIYCDFREEYGTEDFLSSIAKQLCFEQPLALLHAKDLHTLCIQEDRRLTAGDLIGLLRSIFSIYTRSYVIMDALDEWNRICCGKLLQHIFNLQADCQMNFLATSRHIPWIDALFCNAKRAEVSASEPDVASYVYSRMNEFPEFVINDPQLQEEMKIEIARAVDGMFLLAKLHSESLSGEQTLKSLRKALKEIPRGSNTYQRAYEHAYDKVMERINGQRPQERTLAIQLLSWLAFAKKPLKAEELQDALTVESGLDYLDQTNTPDMGRTVSLCAGLVKFNDTEKILELIHYTTQEFLTRDDSKAETPLPNAQKYITCTCVTYLMYRQFGTGSCKEREELEKRLETNIFYNYAASHWGDHARDLPTLPQLVFEFLECVPKTTASSQVLIHTGPFGEWISERSWTNSFHLVAYFGISKAAEFLLQTNPAGVNSRDKLGWTPFFVAALRGHVPLIQLLGMTSLVDVNLPDNEGCTPLTAAVLGGHEEAVKILLTIERVDVNLAGPYSFGGPLTCAVRDGNEKLVRLLLEAKNIDLNYESHGGFTPLMLAIDRGHTAVVELLLAHSDVKVSPESHGQYSPLMLAIEGEHQRELELLLAKDGLEMNPKNHLGQTPLMWCAERGITAVMDLILAKRGVELNFRNGQGQTSLIVGAMAGHVAAVELLLRTNGINKDLTCNIGRTALSWAAEKGHRDMVQVFLKDGEMDVNSKDKNGRVPLLWVAKARLKTIERMRRTTQRTEQEERMGLMLCEMKSHVDGLEEIFQLLIKHGADINIADVVGQTPLSSLFEGDVLLLHDK